MQFKHWNKNLRKLVKGKSGKKTGKKLCKCEQQSEGARKIHGKRKSTHGNQSEVKNKQ